MKPRSLPRLAIALLVGLVCLFTLTGCEEETMPLPTPTPTVRPTPTPGPLDVLRTGRYAIIFDGTLLAMEELRIERFEDGYLVYSELQRFGGVPAVEKRSVQLSPILNPVAYALERDVLGVRSVWTAYREGDAIHCFANDQAWYAPVYVPNVMPAPNLIVGGYPSALPFALLALRLTEEYPLTAEMPPFQGQVLDVQEPLPVSRLMTVTVAVDQGQAVIGTIALEGQIAGALNDRFTMWVRPGSRQLFGVRFDGYRFGFLDALQDPALRGTGRLMIERVGQWPTPTPMPSDIVRTAFVFRGSDETERQGTLLLPEGEGPFPALVVLGEDGVYPPIAALEPLARKGWAILYYYPSGVDGSQGGYQRAPSALLAEDARLAGAALRQHPQIDPTRVILLGVREGGIVGALAVAGSSPYAGAVLASFATDVPLYPDLVEERILTLAAYYGWDEVALARYRLYSIEAWHEWLASGTEERVFLGRRVDITPLTDWQRLDLESALAQAKVPILVLHGQEDTWTPVDGAKRLEASLRAQGARRVVFHYFDGVGADLGGDSTHLWGDEVELVVENWLAAILAP